jgi:hypothetical protein
MQLAGQMEIPLNCTTMGKQRLDHRSRAVSTSRPSAAIISSLALLTAGILACNLPFGPAGAPRAATDTPQSGQAETPVPEVATSTPAPSETPVPSDTPEPTETPTITPTEGPNFAAASVYAVSHLPNDKLLVTVQIPGGVEGDYKAYVSNLPFACEILDQYPDRLYCNGPEPFGLYAAKDASLEILTAADNTTVFTTQFTVPPIPTPTFTPTPKPTATP